MEMSQFHYLPLTPGFFSILVGVFGIVNGPDPETCLPRPGDFPILHHRPDVRR